MGNRAGDEIMDLDLNQEPLQSPNGTVPELGYLLSELESAHEHIEDRIRQLEVVTSRFRQHQRWRSVNAFVEPMVPNVQNEVRQLRRGVDTQERTDDDGKFGKRDGIHLIAKALDLDAGTKSIGRIKGGFFDCNICFDIARDPILTCCGHLFCWPCYYQLSYAHSNVKECPECKGEVIDTSIIPIYGYGNNNTCKSKGKESELKVPSRPKAHRIESTRQQVANNGAFFSSIEERIQQVRNIIGVLDGARTTAERTNFLPIPSHTSQIISVMETEGNQQGTLQFSRLLLQGTEAFSSLTSALHSAVDSAQRLLEDLRTYNNLRSNQRESSDATNGDTLSHTVAVSPPETGTQDAPVEISSGNHLSASSSRMTGVTLTVAHLENQTMDAATEINSTLYPASSSRRGAESSTVLDHDNGVYHERRRRVR